MLVTLAALWVLGKQRNLIDYLILSELLALALEPAVIWCTTSEAGEGGARRVSCWSPSSWA